MDTPATIPSMFTARRGMTPGTLFVLVGLVALTAVIGMQIIRRSAGPPTQGPAPDFTLDLYDGGTFSLADHRGKIVVVNFWGSWCMACREEAAELQSVWEKYRDAGVVVVGVGFRDVDSSAKAFLDEFGLNFPAGGDTNLQISAAYGITGAPETYIVGPDGEVIDFTIGQFQPGWLERTLDRLLSDGPSA